MTLFKRKSYEEEQAAVPRCPNCHEPIAEGELDCAMCGHDLRDFLHRGDALIPDPESGP